MCRVVFFLNSAANIIISILLSIQYTFPYINITQINYHIPYIKL